MSGQTSDKWQAGHDLMVDMMGPQFAAGVEGAARAGNFGADIARMAIEFAFGDVWARPGLDRKMKSTVVIASLITQGKQPELKNHLRFGIDNGLTAADLQEILIQILPYVGFPAVAEAMTSTIEVLREKGLDGGVRTAAELMLTFSAPACTSPRVRLAGMPKMGSGNRLRTLVRTSSSTAVSANCERRMPP